MRTAIFSLVAAGLMVVGCTQTAESGDAGADVAATDTTERNKRLAREFYENLWFSNNTSVYADYVADEYVVHDLGERKNVTEQAIEQKNIADFFHGMGTMTGEMDYQIAEGDMVANRWWLSLSDISEQGQAMGMQPFERVAIINVFRFNEEGKIVEIWNHRHDVELPRPPERHDA
ncbi:ester cyclase [Sphingomicrobium sediminis]|uniref:Ester cyclase n=1 Tax=Sphingomicrobium sediminis TaxID=2950949 RepID=A0A9X2J332_9SPHN|nr:ester cyclase [Sphingomicrobium sediminis]MCM8557665.1 ester cyclase [Sphingomicrobium sediminis]